jgi:hypothetical protein
VDLIQAVQDRAYWGVVGNTVLNLRLPHRAGNFLSERLLSFQERFCFIEKTFKHKPRV